MDTLRRSTILSQALTLGSLPVAFGNEAARKASFPSKLGRISPAHVSMLPVTFRHTRTDTQTAVKLV